MIKIFMADLIKEVRIKYPFDLVSKLSKEDLDILTSYRNNGHIDNDGFLHMGFAPLLDFSKFIIEIKEKYK